MTLGRKFRTRTNSWLHRFLIRKRGKRDGRVGMPRVDESSPGEQERQLLVRGDQHMAQMGADYSRSIRLAEAKLSAKIEYFKTLLVAFKDESERYNKRREALQRNVVEVYSGSRSYRVVLFVVALGEFALNAQAFEVFDKPMLLTVLMALAVGILLPAVAHYCGIWVRQWPKPAWRTGAQLFVTAAVVMFCLVAINNARLAYLATEQLTLGTQSGLLDNAFIAINVFVFVGTAVVSYFAHDPDYELENLHKRVSKVDRKLDATDAAIHSWSGKLEHIAIEQRAEIDAIRAIILELISLYREANRLARNGEEVLAFRTIPEIGGPAYIEVPMEEYRKNIRELREMRYKARSGSAVTAEAKSEARGAEG